MLALDRHPRRAHRAARPRGQLLAVRPDRPLRALLGALPRPRPGVRRRAATGPGDDTERFLEFWNLVFMQYELQRGRLADRAAHEEHRHRAWASSAWRRSSRASSRSSRPTSSGRWSSSARSCPAARWGQDFRDHARAAASSPTTAAAGAFLLADGVVPSNEDRGYVLRRIMRRTMRQGHVLGIEGPFLPQLYRRVVEVMGDAYPELRARVADDRALGARRGGELRPHARAGRAPAGRADRAGASRSRPRGSPPRTPSGCTTPTASPTR